MTPRKASRTSRNGSARPRRRPPPRGSRGPSAGARSRGDRPPAGGARGGDRQGAQPRTGSRGHDDRGTPADPRRRRFGQDPGPGAPHRLPRRRQGRAAVPDPRGHVHQQGGRRAARADHQPRRRGRTRRPGGHVPRAQRPRAAPGRRGDRCQPPVRHLRHRRPAGADEADPARGGPAADRRIPAERRPRRRSARAKNEMLDPTFLAENAVNHRERTIARLATRYQQRLKASQALDFDDLLLEAVPAVRRGARGAGQVPGALALSARRRVPGHQPRPIPVGQGAGREVRQPGGRRRRRPVDLLVARRGPAQHPRFRARLARAPPWSSSSATTARRS